MANGITDTHPAQGVVIEAACDWLTSGYDEGQGADRAEAWAFARAQHERRDGGRQLPFRVMGYEGWAVGRVRFGRRDGDALLQLSGELAEQYLGTIVGQADRISRVDLAVTIRLATANPFLGETTFASAVEWRHEHPTAALPSLIQDGDGGATAYIGKRSSDSYLRVYNKYEESRAARDETAMARYVNCWRYELELKGQRSAKMAASAAAASPRGPFVQQQLYQYTIKHGIDPAFGPTGHAMLIPGFRRRSDYQTRLGWLRRAVNPAILSMLPEGDRAEILEALGLGDPHEQGREEGLLPPV